MRHYSIWQEKYGKGRERLLKSLQGYKKDVEALKKSVRHEDIILPLRERKEEISGRMCFVDGGEGISELLGAAFYFIKASGLVIDVGEKEGEASDCFIRDLDFDLLEYDDHVKERVELRRGAMEFDVAIRCVEEQEPKYLFVDGSLYVNFSRRLSDCPEAKVYRKKFSRLLRLCREKGVHVLGVSEDSRSRLFISHLSVKYRVKFPRFMTDSSVLRMLAGNSRYRTVSFTPPSSFESGTGESKMSASFPTVYVQPTELSNPLRVDVPDWEEDLDGIVDLIVQLSRGSSHYGYPMHLYLAHLDAKLEQKHADWGAKQLIHFLSKEEPALYETILKGTRRNARP